MANIEHLLDDIRKNKYCVDMKETFCNALNETNANAEKIESNVKKIKDEIININANAEIIDARCGEENLGNFNRKISSQLDTIKNLDTFFESDVLLIPSYRGFLKGDENLELYISNDCKKMTILENTSPFLYCYSITPTN